MPDLTDSTLWCLLLGALSVNFVITLGHVVTEVTSSLFGPNVSKS